jgi:hypothetical protein
VNKALISFLQPLYQDVDGTSRRDDAERVAGIARRLHPSSEELELLLLFYPLGKWLEKVGNLSRVTLAVPEIPESALRKTARSIRKLDAPITEAERAVAAAILIDGAGVRGLAERFAKARREGSSMMDVIRHAVADVGMPDWLPPDARSWLHRRRERRREVCRMILEEMDGEA